MHFQDMSFSTALEGIDHWEGMGMSGSSFHAISALIPETVPMPRGSAWPDDIIICRCYSLQGQVIHILHLKTIFQLRPNEMTFAEWTKLKSTRIYWAGSMWPAPSVEAERMRKKALHFPKGDPNTVLQMRWAQLKQSENFIDILVLRLCYCVPNTWTFFLCLGSFPPSKSLWEVVYILL